MRPPGSIRITGLPCYYGPLRLPARTVPQLFQAAWHPDRYGAPAREPYRKLDGDVALDSLAPLTGGRAFDNGAVGRAIASALTDARATWEAGFFTTDKEADATFHELRVSTTRKDARILAPDGYTAETVDAVAARNLALVQARQFDTPDIGLRASFNSEGTRLHFEVRIDPRDLVFQSSGMNRAAELLLAFVFSGAVGPPIALDPVRVNVSLNRDQFDAAMKDGYVMTTDFAPPAGTAEVRIVVQDASTGMAGSLSFPIGLP